MGGLNENRSLRFIAPRDTGQSNNEARKLGRFVGHPMRAGSRRIITSKIPSDVDMVEI